MAVNTGMKTMRSVRHANFVRKTKGKGPEKGAEERIDGVPARPE